jgi:hypothetical protein
MPASEEPTSQPLWQPTPIDGAAMAEPGPIIGSRSYLETFLQRTRHFRQVLREAADQARRSDPLASQQHWEQMLQAAA